MFIRTENASWTIALAQWYAPVIIGTIRVWHDATNGFLRAKVGADPSSEVDGNILMWGE